MTLSTLGYGDITPLSRPARNLAALEAVFGQLYLAVLIARLVSQQEATSLKRMEKGED
ncbi:MAG: potassium channel family protein [Terriglobia bacterium]